MNRRQGFTLIEVLVYIFIAMGFIVVIGSFVSDITDFRSYFDEALTVEQEIRLTLARMIPEIRSAAQSNIGNYPIESATQTSFVFFSDIDSDGLFERVRYFLNGTTFQKGVIKPSGNPLTYNPANEIIVDVIHNIVLGYDIFHYYDGGYSGSEPALGFPVNIPDVRMVAVTLTADQVGQPGAAPISMTGKVTIRNLRDNT